MGQSASSPAPLAGPAESQTRRRPATFWRRSTVLTSESQNNAQSTPRPRTNRPRPASVNRLSQLLQQSIAPVHESGHQDDHERTTRPSLASRLQRNRHSVLLGAPNALFARSTPERNASSPTLWPSDGRDAPSSTTHRSLSQLQQPDISLPTVNVEDLDLDFNPVTSASASGPATQRPSSRRSSIRLPNSLSDRLAGLRPNRHQTTNSTVLRRRRPPIAGGEDNTALLSRLLSVAAAATAATLLEGTGETMAEARGTATDGDDGSFDGFIQSLESGRLAAALRQGTQSSGSPGSGQAPLNFFRMFRFGAQSPRNGANNQRNPNGDNRMVPIIIVGIRAVPPGTQVNSQEDNGVPPFLDALSTLPTTPFNANSLGQDISESLRGPQNGTRFSHHRRRASMGGLSRFPSAYDNQRHHRSPDRARPQSVASEPSSWPRPPPATPASPNLSTVNSRENTPAPTVPASRRSSYSGTPRRESIIRTTTTTTLETTTEDTPVRSRPLRQRRVSDSEHRNSYPSRRNGIVEPDNNTALPENTRSWIIYVLGGSYPENHPILTTPSLFTDSPTYEDMMLLSTLLGPAKPPVASETDVAQAGGVYKIELCVDDQGQKGLVAVAANSEDRVPIVAEQRCLVCLCDFEKDDEARRLADCGHLFHRECIDEWLTKGRNSCPLCRGQGVQEQKTKPDPPPVDSTAPSPVIPNEPAAA